MHTKIAINTAAYRKNRKYIVDAVASSSKKKSSFSDDRLDQALRTSDSKNFFEGKMRFKTRCYKCINFNK